MARPFTTKLQNCKITPASLRYAAPLSSPVVRCQSLSGASSSGCDGDVTRRQLLGLTTAVAVTPLLVPQPAAAAGFKKELKKRKVPLEDYTVSEVNGLRYFDKEQGRGKEVAAGDTVVVHFDCKFRGIDAVSSRYARTLGGNRTIAEPLEFVAGEAVNLYTKKAGDTAGGLFAGGSGPKPPPAISTAVIGMKPGGRRIVYVDNPDLGYVKGNQEIPAGAAFELELEMLSAVPSKSSSSSSSS